VDDRKNLPNHEALSRYEFATPKNQFAEFTEKKLLYPSVAFTDVLKREAIAISMDGRGRAYDNIFVERLWRSVKHEDIYLNGYATMGELLVGLTKYFAFYNTERPHQSLDNQTPQEVHKTSSGGGAMIVDKYRTGESHPVALRSNGTATGEVRIKIEPARQKAKTGVQLNSWTGLCRKSQALSILHGTE